MKVCLYCKEDADNGKEHNRGNCVKSEECIKDLEIANRGKTFDIDNSIDKDGEISVCIDDPDNNRDIGFYITVGHAKEIIEHLQRVISAG
jgi:hypothetical protein